MDLYNKQDKTLSKWLGLLCFAVVVMIFIGGLTRLTGSGLSITKWSPVTGIIPPISHQDWETEFQFYKESPEYHKINYDMNLHEFKSIYWLEFIHRVVARFTVLAFILPLLFFIYKGNIKRSDIIYYLGIGILLLLQGVMGWYMVKSGLIDNPHVSHFRLAAHLILAVIVYSMIFWQKMRHSFDIILTENSKCLSRYKYIFYFTISLVFIQIFFGALVAGLKAGLIYNTYPMMGDDFIPSELYEKYGSLDNYREIILIGLNDPVLVQFIHRILALLVLIFSCFLFLLCIFSGIKPLRESGYFILLSVILQMLLGIITLLYSVPIPYALAHQIGAVLLLSSLLWGVFLVRPLKSVVFPLKFSCK